MTLPVSQLPAEDPVFDLPMNVPKEVKRWLGLPLGGSYLQYLQGQEQRTTQTAQRLLRITKTAQVASIGITPFPLPVLSAGLYRVSAWLRVTIADGVTSSILASIHSTDGAIACLEAMPAYAGNAVNRPQSRVFVVRVDGATALSYSTTYVSGGGGPAMTYDLELIVEAMGG